MKPRRLLAGATYLLTRRTYEGIFRLAPTPEINNILLFCLLHACEQHKIQLHGFCFMSNHFHLVVTDPHRKLSHFMHWLNLYTSKCLNVLHGRRGLLWAPGSFDLQELHRTEDVLEKLVYVICNPTRAELVKKPAQWPGELSLPRHYAEEFKFSARRPEVFFKKDGDEKDGEDLPRTVSRGLVIPRGFGSREEFRSRLEEGIRRRCQDIADELLRKGRKFTGRKKLSLDPEERPATAIHERKIRPVITCGDRVMRTELLAGYQVFWELHRGAQKQVQAGARDVMFPEGANWWCEYGGMRMACGPPG